MSETPPEKYRPPRPPPPKTSPTKSATFSNQMSLTKLLHDEEENEALFYSTNTHAGLLKSNSDAIYYPDDCEQAVEADENVDVEGDQQHSTHQSRAQAGMDSLKKALGKAKQKKTEIKKKISEKIRNRSRSRSRSTNTSPNESDCETAIEADKNDEPSPSSVDNNVIKYSTNEQSVKMDNSESSMNFELKIRELTPKKPPPESIVEKTPVPQQQETIGQTVQQQRTIVMGRYRYICGIALLAMTVLWPGFIIGFLWGVYVCVVLFFWLFVSEAEQMESTGLEAFDTEITTEQLSKESKLVYKGLMNELRGSYDPSTYHVNNARTILVRLHGNVLRIAVPDNKCSIVKHTYTDDPALRHDPTLIGQRLYDMTEAKIQLRPRRLARRRWWSKKYPICVRLLANAEITASRAVKGSTNTESEPGSEPEQDIPSTSGVVHSRSMTSLRGNQSVTESNSDVSVQRRRRKVLYLFARCSREKERWFHRLRQAACQSSLKPMERSDSFHCVSSKPVFPSVSPKITVSEEGLLYLSAHKQFEKFMSGLITADNRSPPTGEDSSGVVHMDLGRKPWKHQTAPLSIASESISTANALAGRIFYDFCRDGRWIRTVQNKIQGKLSTIRLPYFIETLSLSRLDPGHIPPKITGVYEPTMDEWGLWMDLEVQYSGGIRLALETKVNLMKLKSDQITETTPEKRTPTTHRRPPTRYSDDELPESPESSPDEDGVPFFKQDGTMPKESAKKRILNLVDKIAQSKYFQQATELKSVKRVMEGISSTRLMLMVEVTFLDGTMAVNVPPPPSDRLWYGFRSRPRITLKAVPRVGDRSVDLSSISDWIETRLKILIEKNLVVPNMDDIIVPLMTGNPMLSAGYND